MAAKLGKALLWARDAWLILGITVGLILCIETALFVAFYYLDRQSRDESPTDRRASADAYRNADWPEQYYREFEESYDTRWSSYVYWRHKPYRGRYINIDAEGIRKTWSANGKSTRPLIFFFGGSTLWGTGARDDFTIPSIVAKRLAARGIHARAVNFGESGYVSTQEVIQLIRELQKGNIPDLVIFYDGVNDTYSAYQQRRAGLPENEFNRVKEFNSSKHLAPATALSSVTGDLSTMRFLKGIMRRLDIGRRSSRAARREPHGDPGRSIADDKTLAGDVLKIYESNIEVVDSLAERYSFKALFYWQPTVFEKKHLTQYEDEQRLEQIEAEPFFDTAYGMLRRRDFAKRRETEFHDLSGLFADVSEPLFVDWCHLGETGNEYIAERLAVDVSSIVHPARSAAQRPAPVSPSRE